MKAKKLNDQRRRSFDHIHCQTSNCFTRVQTWNSSVLKCLNSSFESLMKLVCGIDCNLCFALNEHASVPVYLQRIIGRGVWNRFTYLYSLYKTSKFPASFFLWTTSLQGFPAAYIRSKSAETTSDAEPQFHCRACPVGCGGRCGKNTHCRVRLDLNLLRAIPLAVQSFCITACVLIGIALCRLRKTRVRWRTTCRITVRASRGIQTCAEWF